MSQFTTLRQSRKELLKLPSRPWNEESIFDTLLLWPSPSKHESGWGCMTLIGCNDFVPLQLITKNADDFSLEGDHRMDCVWENKTLHLWRNNYRFFVSRSSSSMTIRVVPKNWTTYNVKITPHRSLS